MEECVKDINFKVETSELAKKSVLDLIYKKRCDRDSLVKELKITPSDLKIRIRKELNEYR